MRAAIIGGTGLYELDFLKNAEEKIIDTEYGETKVLIGNKEDREIVFLPRHGMDHSALAYQVNYKANMKALEKLDIKKVFATCAVGSLNEDMGVGDLVLVDQFMDLAWNRESTFGEYSVNMTEPYCSAMRKYYLKAAQKAEVDIHTEGNMIVTGGPRYETALEVQIFKSWGIDVVGMTNSTEASLARELGMCYSVVTVVTDMAAGMTDVEPDLALHKKVFKDNIEKVKRLLEEAVMLVEFDGNECSCQEFYKKAAAARKK